MDFNDHLILAKTPSFENNAIRYLIRQIVINICGLQWFQMVVVVIGIHWSSHLSIRDWYEL